MVLAGAHRIGAAVAVVLATMAPPIAWAQDESGEQPEAAVDDALSPATSAELGEDPGYYERLVLARDPNHLRTLGEITFSFGFGTVWYFLDTNKTTNWDFPSLKDRVTLEAWRLDNNPFGINYIGHALNGLAFHTAPRSNEMSLWTSIGYGFATSFAWEYIFEFREKVSINDLIVTTGAGVSGGEFFHWFARYVEFSHRKHWWHHPLRWATVWPHSMHNAIDGVEARPGVAPDNLGFASDIWHRFRLSYGIAQSEVGVGGVEGSARTAQSMRLDARLAAIPGYLRPGRFVRPFSEGNLTSVVGELELGAGHQSVFVSDTMLLGVHAQSIDSARQGKAGTLGLALGYEYRTRNRGAFRDRLALLHLPGLALDGELTGYSWRLGLRLRGHVDFAGINALTYDAWRADNPDAIDKTILRRQGYYYAWGLFGRAALELETTFGELGALVRVGDYRSQQGLDRNQEAVTLDVRAKDSLTAYEGWMRVGLGRWWFLEGRASLDQRDGSVGGVRGESDVLVMTGALGLRL